MKSHPVADEYALLSNSEYRDLVDDIRKRGLLIPIVVDTDGLIIDGRHRFRACEELGIKCRKVVFTGTDEEKREHAKSLNVFRRHLTESQRAMAAARTVNVANGSNQHRKVGVSQDTPSKPITIADASKTAKVSRSSTSRAVKVLKSGNQELIKAVDDAVVTVAVAEKIMKLPADQQTAAIETGVVPEQPKEKPLSVQFAEALEPLLEKLADLETGSPEAIAINDILAKASAAASSKACDMTPVPHVAKTTGKLFDDEPGAKPIPGRMNPTKDDFELFWKEYPRKVNKQNAKLAFEKAFRRLRFEHNADEAIQVIIKGVRVYAVKADPDVLCHPTTWLNGSRWEDDPESIGSQKTVVKSRGEFGSFDPESQNVSFEERQRRARL